MDCRAFVRKPRARARIALWQRWHQAVGDVVRYQHGRSAVQLKGTGRGNPRGCAPYSRWKVCASGIFSSRRTVLFRDQAESRKAPADAHLALPPRDSSVAGGCAPRPYRAARSGARPVHVQGQPVLFGSKAVDRTFARRTCVPIRRRITGEVPFIEPAFDPAVRCARFGTSGMILACLHARISGALKLHPRLLTDLSFLPSIATTACERLWMLTSVRGSRSLLLCRDCPFGHNIAKPAMCLPAPRVPA